MAGLGDGNDAVSWEEWFSQCFLLIATYPGHDFVGQGRHGGWVGDSTHSSFRSWLLLLSLMKSEWARTPVNVDFLS